MAGTPSEESDGETEVEQPVRPEALLPRRRRTGVLIGVAVALWLVMVAASDDVVQTKINDALVPSRPVAQSQGATSSGLAVTGGDVLGLAGIGVGAVATGAALLAARRRLSLS